VLPEDAEGEVATFFRHSYYENGVREVRPRFSVAEIQHVRPKADEDQALYYAKTASAYSAMHDSTTEHEHYRALAFIQMACDMLDLKTLLDVGSGTGRGVRFLLERGRDARGIEPVSALIAEAEKSGIPKGRLVEGSGYALPFQDHSFDAVLECGVLHHVANPSLVISEMMRVSRKAIFLSDNNRFGQGTTMARVVKLALYKLGLWNVAMFLQTKGKMYKFSEGDGIYYSYSVFESYNQLYEWADKIWIIPTASTKPEKSLLHPLTTSSHVLLCALKEAR
jgi:ubiquinone/menaquinone biosynthesis C-methylase UbiE